MLDYASLQFRCGGVEKVHTLLSAGALSSLVVQK